MIRNCFVIMGFGEKPCPKTQRTIDLDITYNKLIRPTMDKLKITCTRSDEVISNKSIDGDLFELLYKSDLVIADISTLNSNAIYELGIRHALKPYATIIIAEDGASLPFDINHLKIHKYKHNGLSISKSEITKLSNKLMNVIKHINSQSNPDIDSPLYTFLDIKPPNETDEHFQEKLSNKSQTSDSIYKLISMAQDLKNKKKFSQAEDYFSKALELTNDEYIVKELAICIYKQNENNIKLLEKAEKVLTDFTTSYNVQNTELLSTFGAIYKKKWHLTKNSFDLEKCIENYRKSYEISNYYYPGVNYAFSLIALAYYSKGAEDRITNYLWGKKLYKDIIELCEKDYDSSDYWINATLVEAYFVLNNTDKFQYYKDVCEKLVVVNDWKIESTLDQLQHLQSMLNELQAYNTVFSPQL